MAGMHVESGTDLGGFPHVVQSIRDILTTPIGTRVMRRDYGSAVPAMLDRPLNALTIVDASVAIAEALERWEPRFRLELVTIDRAAVDGNLAISLKGIYLPRNEPVDVEVTL